MALKFLNKKGWHTGSLRNIENVWKAEQKHDAEQKKLEELRKQILEEREKSEFRLLQEQAGLIPKQERLDFLYDSGLAVGKGSSDGFKALESYPKPEPDAAAAPSSSNQHSSAPGALFEDKPQSANDAWRKLHSDPLLLIRQREQEALARIKNNPVQMANIRKSVQDKKKHKEKKKEHKKHSHKSSKHSSSMGQTSEDDDAGKGEERKKTSYHHGSKKYSSNVRSDSETEEKRKTSYDKYSSSKSRRSEKDTDGNDQGRRRTSQQYDDKRRDKYTSNTRDESETEERKRNHGKSKHESHSTRITETPRENSERPPQKQRRAAPKLSEEEKAARLREMQMDAVLHEEQRWKRLKTASENDAREGSQASSLGGQNFLHAAQKSVYGAEKGGSSTIEESVRRRKYYSQGQSESNEGNAFRR